MQSAYCVTIATSWRSEKPSLYFEFWVSRCSLKLSHFSTLQRTPLHSWYHVHVGHSCCAKCTYVKGIIPPQPGKSVLVIENLDNQLQGYLLTWRSELEDWAGVKHTALELQSNIQLLSWSQAYSFWVGVKHTAFKHFITTNTNNCCSHQSPYPSYANLLPNIWT